MDSHWTEVDWDGSAGTEALDVDSLVADLAEAEAKNAPITAGELAGEREGGVEIRLWYRGRAEDPASGRELLGFGLLRADGTLRAVLRPEHREMSLFLPMLRWADSRPAAQRAALRVLAQDDDVCLPFLLLRLGFDAGGPETSRPEAGFRIYSGGRVDADD